MDNANTGWAMRTEHARMNERTNLSEREELDLLRRISGGDQRAFETLFEVYGKRIFRYAVRMIGDAARAEEVTNDVMIEVWKSAGTFQGRSRSSTWIIGITRHRCLNAMRGKPVVTVDIDDHPAVLEIEDPAEKHVNTEDTKRTMREAVLELSAEHREVVELTFYQNRSYQEIAEIVGCPENTVKTRMFHANKRLREVLSQRGTGTVALGAVS
jgi:RNA polymerase sigma-70 factor (ECF subfamily)